MKKVGNIVKKVFGFFLIIILLIFSTISMIIYNLVEWILDTWGLLSMDEIVFHLKVPLEGTNKDMIIDAINYCIPMAVVVLFIIIIILISIRERKKLGVLISFSLIVFFCCLDVFSVEKLWKELDVDKYIEAQKKESTFIQDNYVDPRNVSLEFPEEKRNIIYIYLESMETTYMSKEVGGGFQENVIPELTQIAESNISFSNTDKLGGAYPTVGSTWTMGAMFTQSTGMPLKTDNEITLRNEYIESEKAIFPSVYSIGDVLNDAGYKQVLLIGSDGSFAGRRNFFEQHGDYEVIDYNIIKNQGLIPEDYYVWWGFEDEKLFSFAKNELVELASSEKPFNFTLLTVDTHFEDGYVCGLCKNDYDNQYSNVMACSSRQVYEFINWIQQQDFYQNTTIVLVGDHLTMDSDFCQNVDKDYQRTVYNAFINSVVTTENIHNRKFTTLDMFPTTLASMGVKIKGERLGLGVNLFSDEETLAEQFGLKKLDNKLQENSNFYNQLIDIKNFEKTK
ncbi:LTA synthase family protein [Bariatricus sp. SGI.019]|uniref:LTA synthase family protein n=1 Tax=Bariatricus sp. SGI.019 TaxID=3420548 RepID=UPI003CFE87B9